MFWDVLGHLGRFGGVLSCFGTFLDILGHFGGDLGHYGTFLDL